MKTHHTSHMRHRIIVCSTDDGSGGVMVATAAVDGVLPGVMRGCVIAACASLSIPVVQRAPHWSSHDRWREAFLTNR